MSEKEIQNPLFLCTKEGNLNPEAKGWARFPIVTCNLTGNFLRKKKWNYWCFYDTEFLFSVTIADLDYASTFFVYYYDFKDKTFQEQTYIHPLGIFTHLQETPSSIASARSLGLNIQFIPKQSFTYIAVDWFGFHGKHLEARFHVFYPEKQESVNVVAAWSEKKFQFTSKQFGMTVEGEVLLDKKRIHKFINPTSFASLDFGRGIWPRNISWNWIQFVTRIGTTKIGINIGGKWTDGTGITENAILLNDKIIKITEPISIEYNSKNFSLPWRIYSTQSKNIDLYFTPSYVRTAKQNLFLIFSEVNQGLGNFTGIIQVNEEKIYIPGAVGWAEEHIAIW